MASSSSSTPSSQPPKKYDVFISFRGEDTRRSFSSHLYNALRINHIEAFIDDRLKRGDEIQSSLEKAIQDSTLFLVIFSENYASSTWCLEELTKILECSKNQGRLVMPVFYRVSPSHVRNQSGSYQEAFERHERRINNKQRLQKWREALTHAANLSGWGSFDRDDEMQLIQEIVKNITQKLGPIYQSEHYRKVLVGIEKRMTEVESLLYQGSDSDVQFIGIWGMGGIGKSTLAKVLFHKLRFAYEGSCFLANVREESEKYGIDALREKLILKLLRGKESHVGMLDRIDSYAAMRRLRWKKVFIVLDDVDSHRNLEDLARRHEFGPGSKILITTRDKQMLGKEADGIYELEALNPDEALKLFSINAFRTDDADPKEERQIVEQATQYAYGHPLALKVLGSFLYGKTQEAWMVALDKLQKRPSLRIIDILKLSFQGVDIEEKNIFLDIARFFSGSYVEDVKNLLDACGYSTNSGLKILEDRALLDISKRKISMHCLIQDMGREIARNKESIKVPKRPGDPIETSKLLKKNKGREAIEGITLNVLEVEDMRSSPQAFRSMPNQKFLILHKIFDYELPTMPRGATEMMSKSAEQQAIRMIEIKLVKDGVLRLKRIRDFLHLILSYPMRIGYEDFLMQWITGVYTLRFADDDQVFYGDDEKLNSLTSRVEQLLSESPLRYVQVLIPKVITNGGSVSSEASLKHAPQPMHNLATHLALQQLAHILTSQTFLYRIFLEIINIQNIWFSTRNDAEKQTVSANIQANSRIRAAFDDLEIIDLNQTTSAKSRTKNYGNNKCLFLVVEGDGDKRIDPKKVSLPIKGHSQHVVVFITSAQENDELRKKVDLTIKTEDHLLPWELFCNIVGRHSSSAIHEIAVQIVEKCGGHLLATILMAQSLKHVKEVRVWETALEKLCYRDREAIVNAFFNIIKADVISEREKFRLIRCLMVFKFQDVIMSYDQLLALWVSEQLVHTEDEAKSILQNFLECSVLLKFEGPKCWYILLHEDMLV